MKILMVASELSPIAKAGGLGDVAAGLPPALEDLECQVVVAIPGYGQIGEWGHQTKVMADKVRVPMGSMDMYTRLERLEGFTGPETYLVCNESLFGRHGIYGGQDGLFYDNHTRYIFFSKSIPALCHATNFMPDVILANDWQTGLVMALLDQGHMPRTAGVFTIHNIGYLGYVPPEDIPMLGLPDQYLTMDGLEFYGQTSLLKAGIAYANQIVTVSPTYAREIQTSEQGAGLEGLMAKRSQDLSGILNGVDFNVWNPETDPHLPAQFSPDNMGGKSTCKQALLKELDMSPALMDHPLAGMVTRLFSQKGIELLVTALPDILDMDMGLVLLGNGDPTYARQLHGLSEEYPSVFRFVEDFDDPLAHRIMAGADVLCVPSLYEPCGLTQMYALKYGTIPVVRATGGLADTIRDPDKFGKDSNGFTFDAFTPGALVNAMRRCGKYFDNPSQWQALIERAMDSAHEFTWDKAAEHYLDVFHRAVRARRASE